MANLLVRSVNFILAVSGIWIPLTFIAAIPWLQRQLLYFNWMTLTWGVDMDHPETLGFLKGQVAPFRFTSKDGVSLYAWLIAPVAVYARHVEAFRGEQATVGTPITARQVFKCLSQDPEAKLIVYFHGNGATLAQGRRTQEYRIMASGLADKVFILAFDYRGFGKSGGIPSEAGITLDAIAAIRWAIDEGGVSADRIVLHGHSLGTGIATATAHHFINLKPRVAFAGVLLSAGFRDTAAAFQNFGFNLGIPPMNGIKYFPPLQRWFGRRIIDTWRTSEMLADYVRASSRVRLTLIHAKSDGVMPWQHTEELFDAVLQQIDPERLERDQRLRRVELGEGGSVETWNYQDKVINKEIVEHGGHDTMMTWSPVALAISQAFEL